MAARPVNRPDRVYRAGIIGCGMIADTIEDGMDAAHAWALMPYSHAGAYQRCPRAILAAAADTNPDRLRSFGQRRGVDRLYADYRAMLDAEELDVVSICTPTRSHRDVALEVLAHPVKGIFLEKPISESLDQADEMIAAFRARGVAVAVNHYRSFDPRYRRIGKLIADGAIGDPVSAFVHWKQGLSQGCTHVFDLLRLALGREPEWVFGRLVRGDGTFDPGGQGMIGFQGGVMVYLNAVDASKLGAEIDILGTRGRIRAGNFVYPELWQVDQRNPSELPVFLGFPGVTDGRSGMLVAVDELLDAIETGSKPTSDPLDARRNLEIAVAFHLSDRTGSVVSLPVADTSYLVADPWGRDR